MMGLASGINLSCVFVCYNMEEVTKIDDKINNKIKSYTCK